MPRYDLAVVGAGLAGLAAAALASRINKRTIVLEPAERVGGSIRAYSQNGRSFYLGPSLSFGFERGGAIQQLNETLGIAQSASLRSPCYQVALPDRRITVYPEHSETLDELQREFPEEIDRVAEFYREIRKLGIQKARSAVAAFLLSSRTASRFVQRYRFSPEFAAFLDVQAYYFFSRPVASLRLSSLVTLLDSAPFTLEGGFIVFADKLLDVILRNGGEIQYQVPFEQVALAQPGLLVAGKSIYAEKVLLNAEQEVRSFLVAGVQPDVVPAGMLQDVLCVPDYSHPERFFSLSVKEERNAAGSEMLPLTACFFNTPEASAEIQKEQVTRLVPFLDDFTSFGGVYKPVPAESGDQKKLRLKPVRAADNDLLARSTFRGKFAIPDGAGTPLQSVTAALQFIRYLR